MLEATTGELVRVRAYCEGDIDAVHRAVFESVPELSPFETWCTTGFTRDQAAGYVNGWLQAWAAGTAFYFAVEDLESGDYVGSCGLSGILRVHRRACLGYWIRSTRTGRGFGTDAARVVTGLGFQQLGLARIEAEVAVHNAASLRVTEKLGYTREGVMRHRLVLPTGPTDTVMLARFVAEPTGR